MSNDANVTLYYVGGDGRENRPHPLAYGQKIIYTPPVGEAFPRRFTQVEARWLITEGTFTKDGRTYSCVTPNKAQADALKQGRTLDEVFKNIDVVSLNDNDLLDELARRPELLAKIAALVPQKEVVEQPKPIKKAPVKAEVN